MNGTGGPIARPTPSGPTGLRRSSWYYAVAIVAATALGVYLAVWGRRYGLDLRVYRASVSAWVGGHNPYLLSFTGSQLDFTYPPFALLALDPLTWLSFPVTQSLFWLVSVLSATAAVAFVLRDQGLPDGAPLWVKSFGWVCASMLLLEPARSGLDYGQIEFVLMFVVVTDLLVVPPPYRGIALGVAAAIKLTPLIFVLVLIVRRDLSSVARAATSLVTWTVLTWLLWPALSARYWGHDVFRTERVGTVTFASNQSWDAILHRPPFPSTGSPLAWVGLSAATVVLASFIAWRCVTSERQSLAIVAVALAGLMVSPISWTHHWMWVMLLPPILVAPRRSATKAVVRWMLWGLVALTVAGPYWWFSAGAAADAFEALLPLWTFSLLAVWAGTEFVDWCRGRAPTGPSPSERLAVP